MNSTDEQDLSIDNRSTFKFYLFLISAIASTCCTIVLFYHFLSQRQLRHSIHHHVIFLLLFITLLTILIPISFSIGYFATGYSLIASDQFCSLWNYCQYSLSFSNLCVMTFACCERHLLIFHCRLYQQKSRRIILHYLPMILCVIYPFLFYFIAIFLIPCTPSYDQSYIFCTWPCYYNDYFWLGYYDAIVNNDSTNIMIPVLSLLLVLRVIRQKHRMKQQRLKWRRDRKMLMQLLSITIIYIVFWLPNNLVSTVEMWYPEFLIDLAANTFILGPSFSNMFYPFICLLSYPDLIFRRRKKASNRVTPLNFKIEYKEHHIVNILHERNK